MATHTGADNFAVALVVADMPDEDAVEMFRSGYHPGEIADRVKARSGLDVSESHAAAWLTDVGGFDACTNVADGRSMCERPARPGSSPARCTACERY